MTEKPCCGNCKYCCTDWDFGEGYGGCVWAAHKDVEVAEVYEGSVEGVHLTRDGTICKCWEPKEGNEYD